MVLCNRSLTTFLKIMQKRLFAKSNYRGTLSIKHEQHTYKTCFSVPIRVLKSHMTTSEVIVSGASLG